jgi:phosphate transport system substrate-binding protein
MLNQKMPNQTRLCQASSHQASSHQASARQAGSRQASAGRLRIVTAAALVVSALPLAGTLSITPLMAQSAPTTFAMPGSVAKGATVKLVDGSSATEGMSQSLKQAFEGKFAGTQVATSAQSAAAALQAVLDGKADIAALARPLTPEERSRGLVAVPVSREKIAIVVSQDNPFQGNLTLKQFSDIFRGGVTDWSQIGGGSGPIRLVDRPDSSDLRQSFRIYSAFGIGALAAGGNATKLGEDSTAAMVKALGQDGVGYAPVSQLRNQPGVRALTLHNTQPDNPKYPFSQPYLYVFKGPNPNPAAAAFLGLATAPEGQKLANDALLGGAAAKATALAAGTQATAEKAAQKAGDAATGAAKATAEKAGAISGGAAKTAGDAAKTAGDAAKTAGDAAKTAGDAAKTAAGKAGDAAKTATNNLKAGTKAATDKVATDKDGNPLTALLGKDMPDIDGKGGLWGGLGWLWGLSPLLLLPLIWWIFRGLWSGEDDDRLGINLREPNLPDANLPNIGMPNVNGPDLDLPDMNLRGGVNFGDAAANLGRTAGDVAGNVTGAASNLAGGVANAGGAAIAGGAAAAAGAAGAAWSVFGGNRNPDDASDDVGLDGTGFDGASFDDADLEAAGSFGNGAASSPNLIQRATGALSNLFGQATESGGAAVTGAGAAAGAAGAAAWSALSGDRDNRETTLGDDLSLELPDFPEVDGPNVVESVTGSRADLAGDRDFLDFSEPDPGLDLNLPDWIDNSVESATGTASNLASGASTAAGNVVDGTRSAGSGLLDSIRGVGGSALAGGAAAVTGAGAAAKALFKGGRSAREASPLIDPDREADIFLEQPAESYISLMARGPHWAYAYWEVSDALKQSLKQQGGKNLTLRLYDVTGIDFTVTPAHSMQEFDCGDLAQDWHIPIPTSDRDYLVELGYTTDDHRWMMLVRSPHVRIPVN